MSRKSNGSECKEAHVAYMVKQRRRGGGSKGIRFKTEERVCPAKISKLSLNSYLVFVNYLFLGCQ